VLDILRSAETTQNEIARLLHQRHGKRLHRPLCPLNPRDYTTGTIVEGNAGKGLRTPLTPELFSAAFRLDLINTRAFSDTNPTDETSGRGASRKPARTDAQWPNAE
jgi:hypothetical protein